MQKLTFKVDLYFSEKISSDSDILDIANNIAIALKAQADTAGIVPDGADYFTEHISVKPQFLTDTIELSLKVD